MFAISHLSKYEFSLQLFFSFSAIYFKYFVASFIMWS